MRLSSGLLVASILFPLSVFTGCGSSSAGGPGQGGSDGGEPTPSCFDDAPGCGVATSATRDVHPKVTSADRDALAKGNEAFGLAFAQQIEDPTANIVFSPYSLSTALAMSYAGARTTTAIAMASAMHFDLPEARLASAFDDLTLQVDSREPAATSADGGGFHLHSVDAFWKQVGSTIEQPFVDELERDYGSSVWLADFNAPDDATKLIDGWVSDATAGHIPKILQPGSLTPDTKLVLVDAIYFKSAWATAFDPSATMNRSFHAADGTTVSASMMSGLQQDAGYAADDDYEAVDLAYGGAPVSMTIVMPKEGTIDAFAAALDASKLDSIVHAMTYLEVDTTMPKWSFSFGGSIAAPLTNLGMGIAFCEPDAPCDADFTGIVPTKGAMGIQDVIHVAQIDVDETGTEASAATVVVMGTSSSSSGVPQIAHIVVDHPFFFFIRDEPTGALLFAGRVNDPTAS